MTFVCTACTSSMDPAKEPSSVTLCGHLFHKNCVKRFCDDKLNCPECNEPVNYEQVVGLKDVKLLKNQLEFNGISHKSRDIIDYVRKNFSYYDAEEYLIPVIQHLSKQDGLVQKLKNCSATNEKGCFSLFTFNKMFIVKLLEIFMNFL